MHSPVVIVGIGEMGGVFARGFLRSGHPVYPVTRHSDIQAVAQAVPVPALVLIALDENELHPVLEHLPTLWHNRVGLLQNELLPRDWTLHGLTQPTVVAVWFEKKPGRDYKVLVPSPVYGPATKLIEQALETLDIPCWTLDGAAELSFELVRKNVYILTTNIAGIRVGGTVEDLWYRHQDLARTVANEVMDIQFHLIDMALDRHRLIEGMVAAIQGDPAHACMGRSAPARLARALGHADGAGLAVPTLRDIYAHTTG